MDEVLKVRACLPAHVEVEEPKVIFFEEVGFGCESREVVLQLYKTLVRP